jgi:hypothetical protein
MTTTQNINPDIHTLIDQTLALLDPKGTNIHITKAMTVVNLAFKTQNEKIHLSPKQLHNIVTNMQQQIF